MDNLFKIIFRITILLGFGLLAVVLYWLVMPIKTIEFRKQPLPVLNENKEVKSGGYLLVEIDYCKYTKEVPQITRHFVDGVIYNLAEVQTVPKPLGCGKDVLQIYIPRALASGKYTFDQTFHYRPNPIKNIDVSVSSEEFTVTNGVKN